MFTSAPSFWKKSGCLPSSSQARTRTEASGTVLASFSEPSRTSRAPRSALLRSSADLALEVDGLSEVPVCTTAAVRCKPSVRRRVECVPEDLSAASGPERWHVRFALAGALLVALALAIHGLLVAVGFGSGYESIWERAGSGLAQVMIGAGIAGGSLVSPRRQRVGVVLVVGSIAALSVLWYWFLIVSIPVGFGLAWLAYLRGRTDPLCSPVGWQTPVRIGRTEYSCPTVKSSNVGQQCGDDLLLMVRVNLLQVPRA